MPPGGPEVPPPHAATVKAIATADAGTVQVEGIGCWTRRSSERFPKGWGTWYRRNCRMAGLQKVKGVKEEQKDGNGEKVEEMKR
jgi:hypothetical protein